jgi:8-oxoguanine deaminase
LTAREALALATRGGARTLNRDDIGVLAPGMAADVAGFKLGGIETTGADWDPVAALVFCGPLKAEFTIVGGHVIVRNGHMTQIDLDQHLAAHRALSRALMAG